jgi:hypothetical protein
MITQRFRPVLWVGGVAIAATALYTVSLRVANERARLESLDRQIILAKRDIRQLQTEMGTRGSLRQLERWNGEVLALVSPKASQFLPNEAALRRVDGTKLPTTGYVPAPVMITTAEPASGEVPAQTTAEANQSQAERVAMLDETLTKSNAGENVKPAVKSTRDEKRTVRP